MGYRSDVTIVMYPRENHDFALLKLFVDENLPDKFEVHENNNCTTGFKYLLLEFNGIKWYEGYEGVDVYTRLFYSWEDNPLNSPSYKMPPEIRFHYEFMRIGEEWEDVEYHYSDGSDNLLNLSREVYISI